MHPQPARRPSSVGCTTGHVARQNIGHRGGIAQQIQHRLMLRIQRHLQSLGAVGVEGGHGNLLARDVGIRSEAGVGPRHIGWELSRHRHQHHCGNGIELEGLALNLFHAGNFHGVLLRKTGVVQNLPLMPCSRPAPQYSDDGEILTGVTLADTPAIPYTCERQTLLRGRVSTTFCGEWWGESPAPGPKASRKKKRWWVCADPPPRWRSKAQGR